MAANASGHTAGQIDLEAWDKAASPVAMEDMLCPSVVACSWAKIGVYLEWTISIFAYIASFFLSSLVAVFGGDMASDLFWQSIMIFVWVAIVIYLVNYIPEKVLVQQASCSKVPGVVLSKGGRRIQLQWLLFLELFIVLLGTFVLGFALPSTHSSPYYGSSSSDSQIAYELHYEEALADSDPPRPWEKPLSNHLGQAFKMWRLFGAGRLAPELQAAECNRCNRLFDKSYNITIDPDNLYRDCACEDQDCNNVHSRTWYPSAKCLNIFSMYQLTRASFKILCNLLWTWITWTFATTVSLALPGCRPTFARVYGSYVHIKRHGVQVSRPLVGKDSEDCGIPRSWSGQLDANIVDWAYGLFFCSTLMVLFLYLLGWFAVIKQIPGLDTGLSIASPLVNFLREPYIVLGFPLLYLASSLRPIFKVLLCWGLFCRLALEAIFAISRTATIRTNTLAGLWIAMAILPPCLLILVELYPDGGLLETMPFASLELARIVLSLAPLPEKYDWIGQFQWPMVLMALHILFWLLGFAWTLVASSRAKLIMRHKKAESTDEEQLISKMLQTLNFQTHSKKDAIILSLLGELVEQNGFLRALEEQSPQGVLLQLLQTTSEARVQEMVLRLLLLVRLIDTHQDPSSTSISAPAGIGSTSPNQDPSSTSILMPAEIGSTSANQDPSSTSISVPAGIGSTSANQDPSSTSISVPAGIGSTSANQLILPVPPKDPNISVPAGVGSTSANQDPSSTSILMPAENGSTSANQRSSWPLRYRLGLHWRPAIISSKGAEILWDIFIEVRSLVVDGVTLEAQTAAVTLLEKRVIPELERLGAFAENLKADLMRDLLSIHKLSEDWESTRTTQDDPRIQTLNSACRQLLGVLGNRALDPPYSATSLVRKLIREGKKVDEVAKRLLKTSSKEIAGNRSTCEKGRSSTTLISGAESQVTDTNQLLRRRSKKTVSSK